MTLVLRWAAAPSRRCDCIYIGARSRLRHGDVAALRGRTDSLPPLRQSRQKSLPANQRPYATETLQSLDLGLDVRSAGIATFLVTDCGKRLVTLR